MRPLVCVAISFLTAVTIPFRSSDPASIRPVTQEAKSVRLPLTPTYSITLSGDAYGIHLADMNADGFLDLLVAVNEGGEESPSVAYVSEKGRFSKRGWTSDDKGVSAAIAVGDLDGDTLNDIAVVRYNSDPMVAYRNRGGGTIESSPFWKSSDTDWARHVLLGDFDYDGFVDLFAENRIYRGSASGPNSTADWKLAGTHAVSGLLWIDVNGDARRDLIISSWSSGAAYSVFLAQKRDFSTKPDFEAALKGEFGGPAAGDVDGDGYPEIFVCASTFRGGDGRVRMYRNDKGRLAGVSTWMTNDVDCKARTLLLSDFDRDGDLDLFVLADDHTSIYANQAGLMDKTPTWRASIVGDSAVVADLDKNGWLDLVVANSSTISFYMGNPIVAVAKAAPFPTAPLLKPLTTNDLLPDVDSKIESLLLEYRRERTPDLERQLRERAGVTLEAIRLLGWGELGELVRELQPHAEQTIGSLIDRLSSESEDKRLEAVLELTKCGSFAIPHLKKAESSGDAEVRVLAKRTQEAIDRTSRECQSEAIEVLGIGMARLTHRLRERYGLEGVKGVVILRVPDGMGPSLHLSNLREGDVLLGIGPFAEYGRVISPVQAPLEVLLSILKQDSIDEREGTSWLLAGYQYYCGPLHPSDRGKIRQWRMMLTPTQWTDIERAHKAPKAWKP